MLYYIFDYTLHHTGVLLVVAMTYFPIMTFEKCIVPNRREDLQSPDFCCYSCSLSYTVGSHFSLSHNIHTLQTITFTHSKLQSLP